ncbi:hypothetical protein PROFUN_11423 [Planoprotostelium fungivorum]|uniref:Uncharacterized protein n=1 Tax=Planoprotostelium fungivorum TaxID=1890364 RepID=A0A2P6NA87_9EUKA|nr:hypothetical protein PROFUN_11423 [Planoprotostelium fungivorum]
MDDGDHQCDIFDDTLTRTIKCTITYILALASSAPDQTIDIKKTYMILCGPRRHDMLFRTGKPASVKIGMIQRRLAWPLRKDDTQNREVPNFLKSRTSELDESIGTIQRRLPRPLRKDDTQRITNFFSFQL